MHSLLIGNGLNRLSSKLSWAALLEQLAVALNVSDRVRCVEQKPLSMLFEEICAHAGGKSFREMEHSVKKKIGTFIGEIEPTELHRQYVALFSVILTPVFSESRYSLFRRYWAGGKEIWRIHGDAAFPESILLGYDHYAGYLQKFGTKSPENIGFRAVGR
jgi:hypothetical protein